MNFDILHKKGPRVESCGAPGHIESGEENLRNMWTEEDLFSVLINKLYGILPKS
jgi:hypothetical protein